jgi:hypothetical protein
LPCDWAEVFSGTKHKRPKPSIKEMLIVPGVRSQDLWTEPKNTYQNFSRFHFLALRKKNQTGFCLLEDMAGPRPAELSTSVLFSWD